MTALRGFRLTYSSYESDENVVPLATLAEVYHCVLGHVTELRFATDAEEIPDQWDCPKCGRVAHRDETAARRQAQAGDLGLFSPRTAAAGKTHWDMLLERRTPQELEDLLDERLTLLRSGALGPMY